MKQLHPSECYGALVCDEMDLDQGIYWRPDGTIAGIEDFESIEAEIDALDASLKGEQADLPLKKQGLAKKVLQLAFVSFFGNYQSFFAYFTVGDLQASTLYKILHEATGRLAQVGIHVISWCGDNYSVNQSCWQIIVEDLQSINPFTGDPLWPLADLPHTLKTTRNAVESSHENSSKRLLRRGRFIVWDHLEKLYDQEWQRTNGKPGFRVTKLTDAHINLTPYSR